MQRFKDYKTKFEAHKKEVEQEYAQLLKRLTILSTKNAAQFLKELEEEQEKKSTQSDLDSHNYKYIHGIGTDSVQHTEVPFY